MLSAHSLTNDDQRYALDFGGVIFYALTIGMLRAIRPITSVKCQSPSACRSVVYALDLTCGADDHTAQHPGSGVYL